MMKSFYRAAQTATILLIFINGHISQKSYKQLKFNSNGKFRIVQLTDTHMGETDERDINTQKVIRQVLQSEQPDLVVMTGDIVSGNVWDGNQGWFASIYQRIVDVMNEFNVHWASTAGNHDNEGDLSRKQISELDQAYALSLTRPNAAPFTEAFNYMIPIYDKEGQNIVTRMWFIDSGDNSGCLGKIGYDCIKDDQINWFRQANNDIPESDPSKGRGFMFMHIPLNEYMNLINEEITAGVKGEDVCCGAYNTGMFSAIKEQKTIEWVSSGHDHNNDYYGSYQGIYLGYGRKTGYGSYGPEGMLKGARIFEITENPYTIETWIRQEDGTKMVQNFPQFKPIDQYVQLQCCGKDAVSQFYSYKYTLVVSAILMLYIVERCFQTYKRKKAQRALQNQEHTDLDTAGKDAQSKSIKIDEDNDQTEHLLKKEYQQNDYSNEEDEQLDYQEESKTLKD
eukprot:403361077